MIDRTAELPVTQQCCLLDIRRSSVYYQPLAISSKDLELMRQIDEIHLAWPFYGSQKTHDELLDRGYEVGRNHARRLMHQIGIEALYSKHIQNTKSTRICRAKFQSHGQIRCRHLISPRPYAEGFLLPCGDY